jgi:hypothetical protein
VSKIVHVEVERSGFVLVKAFSTSTASHGLCVIPEFRGPRAREALTVGGVDMRTDVGTIEEREIRRSITAFQKGTGNDAVCCGALWSFSR